MTDAAETGGSGPVQRFGRTETWIDERGKPRLLWTIYEARDRGDFLRGVRVAAFETHADALAFMQTTERPKFEWNAAEAVFAFCGWLSTRRESTTMSAYHDASSLPKLIDEFSKRHGLAAPRPGWEQRIVPDPEAR